MSLDAYSLCPGGTGKKIKFCCGDFLPELQKIDRMLEGQQYLACLKHVDRLLEQEPGRDRACLLATKCVLLRATDQIEAARATAAAFLVKYPDNQIALAELAILAAEHNPRAALDLIQRALRVAAGALSGRTYQAMGMTAGALLHAGLPLPARALLQMQSAAFEDDDRPSELLSALSQATDIPLLLRDDPPLASCPDDVPWKDRFIEAEKAVGAGDWQTGAQRLAALAADVPDAPVIWRNLATLRGWLADNAGCADALRKYAALRVRETTAWRTPSRPRPRRCFWPKTRWATGWKCSRSSGRSKTWSVRRRRFFGRRGSGPFRLIPRSSATARRRRRRPPTCCWIAPCPSRPKG